MGNEMETGIIQGLYRYTTVPHFGVLVLLTSFFGGEGGGGGGGGGGVDDSCMLWTLKVVCPKNSSRI